MIDFTKHTILVVGDVMLDKYVYGSVSRISPEAPIPVLKINKNVSKLGGAANVAKNLVDLGAKVILTSVVNNDPAGVELMNILDENGIEGSMIIDPDRPTTIKTRFMSDGHHLLRIDEEITKPVSYDTATRIVDDIKSLLARVDVVILSDYNKGVLSENAIERIIEAAQGKIIIVDPKKSTFYPYKGCTVITPNEKELFWATGVDDLTVAAEKALQQSDADSILLTRSEKGMALFRKGKEPLIIPALAKSVVDVCGAGDTVVATLAACLAAGETLEDSAVTANQAAAIVVGKIGTATVSAAELRAAQHQDDKIAELSVALDIISTWKSQGLKVGFTNGCYDLVHPGHVQMLKKCRQNCDRLVVGLNSDDSVKRLKGESRPIQNEFSRATVLSGFSSVDLVVIFEEDTPLHLIEKLLPDVMMKGADYQVDTVVGADVVISNGGEVKLIELEQGHSTSNIVEKLNKK